MMIMRNWVVLPLLAFRMAWCYEILDENEVTSRTCRLAVNAVIIQDETLQKSSGRVLVTVHVFDGEGNPYRGEPIVLTATSGTFLCRLPDDTAAGSIEAEETCFSTGDDGKANVFLVNIPFNQPLRIKATHDCDGRLITGTASVTISRGVVRKKKRVRP